MKHIVGFVLLAMLVLPLNLYAADKSNVPKKYRTPQGLYLTPKETYKLVKDRKQGKNLLFLDIRTQAELEFVGWTNLVDANLPYLFNDFDEWDSKKHWFGKGNNTEFVRRVKAHLARKKLTDDSVIILLCRSGDRSASAAALLDKAGLKNVYTVVGGFEGYPATSGKDKGKYTVNGWKNEGIPWTYRLIRSKMYFALE